MSLENYFRFQFRRDLQTIEFQRPSLGMLKHAESFRIDMDTVYFGGRDWENVIRDINRIEKNNLEYFLLCLFTITIIDLAIFTHYREQYKLFRRDNKYPKFGWSGFGPHYEDPKKLLHIPEVNNLIIKYKILEILEEYFGFLVKECEFCINKYIPNINTKDFLNKIINDKDFQITEHDKNSIFERIYYMIKRYVDNEDFD